MSEKIAMLSQLNPGDEAKIVSLSNPVCERRRLMELGFCPGTTVKCVYTAPSGNPVAYLVKNSVIAVRREISAFIAVCLDNQH